jgi:hypothetical protein
MVFINFVDCRSTILITLFVVVVVVVLILKRMWRKLPWNIPRHSKGIDLKGLLFFTVAQ